MVAAWGFQRPFTSALTGPSLLGLYTGTPPRLWPLLSQEDLLACLLELHTRKLPHAIVSGHTNVELNGSMLVLDYFSNIW
jgi:hypothetical protein